MRAMVSYLLVLQKYISKKRYILKAKNSEIKDYGLCLGNISKYFTINNMRKMGLKGVKSFVSVHFTPIDANDILDIHKYLMKRI